MSLSKSFCFRSLSDTSFATKLLKGSLAHLSILILLVSTDLPFFSDLYQNGVFTDFVAKPSKLLVLLVACFEYDFFESGSVCVKGSFVRLLHENNTSSLSFRSKLTSSGTTERASDRIYKINFFLMYCDFNVLRFNRKVFRLNSLKFEIKPVLCN